MAKREVRRSLTRLVFLCILPTKYSTRIATQRPRAKICQQNTYRIHRLYCSQIQRTEEHRQAKIQKMRVFNRNQTHWIRV